MRERVILKMNGNKLTEFRNYTKEVFFMKKIAVVLVITIMFMFSGSGLATAADLTLKYFAIINQPHFPQLQKKSSSVKSIPS